MEAKDTCATCAALIRLCAGMDFFPADAEVRRLLVGRLHRLAKNHDHAKAMINRWLDTQTAAPKVADLVALAGEVPSTPGASLPAPCEECAANGGNWRVVHRGGAEGMDRCLCARGVALRALDGARKAA